MTAHPSKERRIVRAENSFSFVIIIFKKKKSVQKERIIPPCESNTQELLSATSVFAATKYINGIVLCR